MKRVRRRGSLAPSPEIIRVPQEPAPSPGLLERFESHTNQAFIAALPTALKKNEHERQQCRFAARVAQPNLEENIQNIAFTHVWKLSKRYDICVEICAVKIVRVPTAAAHFEDGHLLPGSQPQPPVSFGYMLVPDTRYEFKKTCTREMCTTYQNKRYIA